MNRRDTEKHLDRGMRGEKAPSLKVLKERYRVNPLSLTSAELCRLLEVQRIALDLKRRVTEKMKWSKKN